MFKLFSKFYFLSIFSSQYEHTLLIRSDIKVSSESSQRCSPSSDDFYTKEVVKPAENSSKASENETVAIQVEKTSNFVIAESEKVQELEADFDTTPLTNRLIW
jgi:hypothetical protein